MTPQLRSSLTPLHGNVGWSAKLACFDARSCARFQKSKGLWVDEVYRGFRIAIKLAEGNWLARITRVQGSVVPPVATATSEEGLAVCLARSRHAIDLYLTYLSEDGP